MNRGILPGLVITAAGVLLTLHNFDILPLGRLRPFWPLLILAFGISKLFGRPGKERTVGAVFASLGAVLQLSTLGLLDVSLRQAARFWPLAVVGLGVHLMAGARHNRSPLAGVILIGLGLGLQFKKLGWIDFDVWRLWPVALIAFGVALIQRALRAKPKMR